MAQSLGVLMIVLLAYLVTWWLAMNWRAIGAFVGYGLLAVAAGIGAYNLSSNLQRHRDGRD